MCALEELMRTYVREQLQRIVNAVRSWVFLEVLSTIKFGVAGDRSDEVDG